MLLLLPPTRGNCIAERASLCLFLIFNYCFNFIIAIDSLICSRVRYSPLMQVLEVWHMAGYVGLYVLCCKYVRDEVNCLLYTSCLLFAGRVSINISIWVFIFMA